MDSTNHWTKIISKAEYYKFLQGKADTEIHKIWREILAQLPENLRKEAESKGFTVKEYDQIMELITIQFVVPNASEELNSALLNTLPFVICE